MVCTHLFWVEERLHSRKVSAQAKTEKKKKYPYPKHNKDL